MEPQNPGRSAADELLAVQLAAGKTLAQAAKAAGVSEATVDRRQRDPEFRKRVAELRAEIVTRATARLSAGMTKAADVLVRLLGDKDKGVKFKAAVKVVELATRLREYGELAEQVAELQRLIAATKGGKP